MLRRARLTVISSWGISFVFSAFVGFRYRYSEISIWAQVEGKMYRFPHELSPFLVEVIPLWSVTEVNEDVLVLCFS